MKHKIEISLRTMRDKALTDEDLKAIHKSLHRADLAEKTPVIAGKNEDRRFLLKDLDTDRLIDLARALDTATIGRYILDVTTDRVRPADKSKGAMIRKPDNSKLPEDYRSAFGKIEPLAYDWPRDPGKQQYSVYLEIFDRDLGPAMPSVWRTLYKRATEAKIPHWEEPEWQSIDRAKLILRKLTVDEITALIGIIDSIEIPAWRMEAVSYKCRPEAFDGMMQQVGKPIGRIFDTSAIIAATEKKTKAIEEAEREAKKSAYKGGNDVIVL